MKLALLAYVTPRVHLSLRSLWGCRLFFPHCGHEEGWKVGAIPVSSWKNKNEEDWGSHRTSDHPDGGPDIFIPVRDLKCFKHIYLLCVCVIHGQRSEVCPIPWEAVVSCPVLALGTKCGSFASAASTRTHCTISRGSQSQHFGLHFWDNTFLSWRTGSVGKKTKNNLCTQK